MHCAPAIVISASSTVRQGLQQLKHAAIHASVVLVREYDGDVLYYLLSAGDLRERLSHATAAGDVATAIDLSRRYQPARAGQLSRAVPPGSVALEGRQVIGIMVDGNADGDLPDGGWEDVAAAWPPANEQRPPPGYAPPVTRGGIPTGGPAFAPEPAKEPGPLITRGHIKVRGLDSVGIESDSSAQPTEHGATGSPSVPSLFRAYPDVTAPGQVGGGQRFALKVGFSEEPSPSMAVYGPPTPVIVLAGTQPEFVIQVTGFGFTFPDGIQQTLVVDREDLKSRRVTFTVQADPIKEAAPRFLEVSYEFEGAVVGRTWAQVRVMPGLVEETDTPALIGGSGVVSSAPGQQGPHLTVDIFSNQGHPELKWLFHCPYADIGRPDAVTTTLGNDSAQSFAVQLMRQVPSTPPGPSLEATMHGAGDQIADAITPEFWPIFEEVWKRARAANEPPRLQFTTTEHWVPWELAWVDRRRLREPDSLLPDCEGATLGQLWEVSRWTPPTSYQATGSLPASPPAPVIEADEMAVIVGNYHGTPGVAQLPMAVKEGDDIAAAYAALRLEVSDTDVTALMQCALQRGDAPFHPTVIHFAGHGQTDVNNPQFTGLVLANGNRLNPFEIRGFRLVEQEQPFVFLNACEAGVGGETMSDLGGLVGAFLAEGARGFIAPLWKVDDVEAREIAVDFYRRTFVDGQTVGEAMREIRRRFTPDSQSATALAYVFYGNPGLRFQRTTR
ncbi:CHAT domain-containing protein [Mycobacterium sp. E3247]|uniref:CHAT domain-containing protein n=1 Tax=Mycobacterium sp. E3247 TaxID=1856864 RepID=UPI0009EF099F|nr:CHAT domain-containing protein [Mycobacterium sp. E3247]